MFNAVETVFHHALSFSAAAVHLSQINRDQFFFSPLETTYCAKITRQWRAGHGDGGVGSFEMHLLKSWRNYRGRLLTLGKMMRKTLPGGGALNLCPLPVPQLPCSIRGDVRRGGTKTHYILIRSCHSR